MNFVWKTKSQNCFECETGAFLLEASKVDEKWYAAVCGRRNELGVAPEIQRSPSTGPDRAKKDAESLFIEMIQPYMQKGARRETILVLRMLSEVSRIHRVMADEAVAINSYDDKISNEASADAIESVRDMVLYLGVLGEVQDQALIDYLGHRWDLPRTLMTENHLQRLRSLAGVSCVEDRAGSTLIYVEKEKLDEVCKKLLVLEVDQHV